MTEDEKERYAKVVNELSSLRKSYELLLNKDKRPVAEQYITFEKSNLEWTNKNCTNCGCRLVTDGENNICTYYKCREFGIM